jgi:CheY-like chemotaxis protein
MPGKKLLVADDSLTIQKVIRLALSNEGYEIQAVSDGNDAVQQISLFHPDVVLIDVSLPGKSAFEVKRDINAHEDLEEVRFVLMSSAFEKVDESQVDEVVFHGRLTKPFDPAHLRQVLTDVLGQVTAKRMEKTSILTRPTLDAADPSPDIPPPMPPSFSSFEEEEEWEENGIHPEELPPIPPSPPENLNELWEASELPNPLGMVSPPPLPISSSEEDIKHLTDSTMRGLEDFQWSVSEPSLKPLPSMMDNGGSNFEITPPPGPESIELSHLSSMEEMIEAPPFFNTPAEIPPLPSRDLPAPAAAVPAVSEAQIEAMVRSQVQVTIERLAQKLLPEVAERVIKQEIHRLLSE